MGDEDGRRKVTDQELLAVFHESDEIVLTASEVSEGVALGRSGVNYRLKQLEERGLIGSKKAGASGKVYYLPELQKHNSSRVELKAWEDLERISGLEMDEDGSRHVLSAHFSGLWSGLTEGQKYYARIHFRMQVNLLDAGYPEAAQCIPFTEILERRDPGLIRRSVGRAVSEDYFNSDEMPIDHPVTQIIMWTADHNTGGEWPVDYEEYKPPEMEYPDESPRAAMEKPSPGVW